MVKKIGKYEFVESGSIIAHVNDIVTLSVMGFSFEFVFKEDVAVKETKVDATGGGVNLILTFTNFNLGVGHVNTVPLPVGNVGIRKLYLNYAVYGFGSPISIAKIIHYTFMLG